MSVESFATAVSPSRRRRERGPRLVGAEFLKLRKRRGLVLSASARSGRVRHALSTLASELGVSFGMPGERVSVRFGDEIALAREGAARLNAQVA